MTELIIALASGVKYSIFTGLALGIGFSVATKPEEKTFWPHVDQLLSSQNQQTSVTQRLMAWGITTLSEKTSTVQFQDFVVLRIANVTLLNGKQLKFWGAFQNWYLQR